VIQSDTLSNTDASNEKMTTDVTTADLEAQTNPASPENRRIRFKIPVPHLSKRSRLRDLFTPTKTIGPAPGYGRSTLNILGYSPLTILLAFIPVSWALHWTHQSDIAIFTTSALAIIPLAALLGFGTEQIAIRTSSAVAGFLNVSLGNLVELIIAGIALQRCELSLVQSSLLGGLLSNLLLVLGMSFIVGGLRFPEQSFQPIAAQLHASLLVVSVIALMMPTAFVSHPLLLVRV
jgi:Ca2+:H+ antiporter